MLDSVNLEKPCWELVGTEMMIHKRPQVPGRPMARAIYEHFHGHVARYLVVAHACSNEQCINPRHLFASTRSFNIVQGSRRLTEM